MSFASDPPALRNITRHHPGEFLLEANFLQVRTSDVIGTGPGGAFVQRAGDTMLGQLTLAGDPILPLQAATRQFVEAQAGNFVDAPSDGPVYGRQFGAWASALPISGGTLTGNLQLPAGTLLFPAIGLGAADGTGVSRAGNLLAFSAQGAITAAGGTAGWQFYQPINMLNQRITAVADATAPTDALNLRTADARFISFQPVGGWLPTSGGTMTGPLALHGDPSSPLEAATMGYVDAIRAGLLPVAGGTMTGPLSLPLTPTLDAHATSKTYVDQSIASQALYQGTWAVGANDPPLNPPVPAPFHGYMWICTTADPFVPENPPAGMPGISGFGTITHGARIIWNDILGLWDHVVTVGGLDMTAADARYLQLTGGGPLTGTVYFDLGGVGVAWPTGEAVYHGPNGLVLRRAIGQASLITEASTGANPEPVLMPSQGDLRYLQLATGGAITGELTLRGDDVVPPLYSGLTIGAGRGARIYYGPGGLRISRGNADEPVYIENFNGSVISEIVTFNSGDARYLTQLNADTRYFPLIGGQLNGNLSFPSANGITWPTGGIIYEPPAFGLTFRRSLGQNALWTENNAGAIRNRVLVDTDLPAPSIMLEPAAAVVPAGGAWTVLFDVNFPTTLTGNHRLMISLSINLAMGATAQLGVVGARVSQPPTNVERRTWAYGVGTGGNAPGINVTLFASVTFPNPRVAVEIASFEGAGFTTTTGAANPLRSQVVISDLGPVP